MRTTCSSVQDTGTLQASLARAGYPGSHMRSYGRVQAFWAASLEKLQGSQDEYAVILW
jgi:hypothetical protein